MILIVSSFVLFFYIAASLFLFSPCRPLAKWLSITLLFLISQKYIFYEWLGGAFFAPELPRPFLLTMEALYGAMIFFFFMLVLKDIFKLVLWLLRRFGRLCRLPFSPGVFNIVLAVLSLGLGVWGTWQSVRVPDVRTVELRVPSLPRGLDGFSIVQLTDTHIGPLLKKDWLQQVVNKANSLSPDLVVLTGDYIDGTAAALREEVTPFGKLHARYGVYGVTGNHEYYWNAAEWSAIMKELNVIMLHNEHRVLAVGEDRLIIAGMPDPTEQQFGGEGPNIELTMKDAPDAPCILLEHQPREASTYSHFADIQLSGHTHGGLIVFLQPLLAMFNSGFINGQYTVNDMRLYISPGTGLWNGFSCRIGVPSELTHIILRSM